MGHAKELFYPPNPPLLKQQSHMQEKQEVINPKTGPWMKQFCLWGKKKKREEKSLTISHTQYRKLTMIIGTRKKEVPLRKQETNKEKKQERVQLKQIY